VDFGERLENARAHRWSVSDLIVAALDNCVIGDDSADELLGGYSDSARAVRSYALTPADVGRVDALGDRWRMNRSQVLTVVLTAELDRRCF